MWHDRVFNIIKKVSEKDPASDANVALAKILFGQVSFVDTDHYFLVYL